MTIKAKITILIISVLLAGCAKQGMPNGGPKDTQIPKSKRMKPENSTLNSQAKEFYIEFDEYVVIKDAENNVIVSPPMKQKPEFKTKGKGIKVTILDTLQPNTTYLFQFKNAIADFTEGNLIPSLEYVFSTGSYIDSMTLNGFVVDAKSMEPNKEMVSVWLMNEEKYRDAVTAMSDTNVPKPQPDYITRTDNEGYFCFNNIKPGNYRTIAIKDEDKNRELGPNEAVAFLDTAVATHVMERKTENDEQKTDSEKPKEAKSVEKNILRLFTPNNELQRLTGSNFIAQGKAVLSSNIPMESPSLESFGEEITWRLNKTCDTLTLWTLRKECDSLTLWVSDPSGINDTLKLKWHSKKKSGKKGGATTFKAPIMRINTNNLPYYDTLALLFTTPLDTSQCKLDSIATIRLVKDSSIAKGNAMLHPDAMKAWIIYKFMQGEKYEIDIKGNSFHDIYGNANDSLHATVTINKAEDYGNLSLTIDGEGEMIVELLDESNKVVKTKRVSGSCKTLFENIKPAKYRLRVIVDSNGNGKWDTGAFASQTQPERVIYLDKTLEIRANWDFEEKLTIDN